MAKVLIPKYMHALIKRWKLEMNKVMANLLGIEEQEMFQLNCKTLLVKGLGQIVANEKELKRVEL
jgi:hypothetical protein